METFSGAVEEKDMSFIKAIPPKLLKDQFGLYTGGNRAGWQGDMDRCWIDNGKHYVYKCPTCGLVITSDRVVTTCLVCREWAEDVAEEMEETNDKT